MVCFLGTLLYSCASCFSKSKIPNPQTSQDLLTGHQYIAQIRRQIPCPEIAVSYSASFTQLAFYAFYVFTDCSAIATATSALAALLPSEATTLPPPLRSPRGLIPLGVCQMVASEEQAQEKKFFFFFLDLDMCWLQKHNSGRKSHTEVQVMVYLSSAAHSDAVFDSATAVSWQKLQKTTLPGTPNRCCTHSKAVGTSNHNIP